MAPYSKQLMFAALAALAVSTRACSVDEDCSLNGVCTASSCVCDAGWTGPDCGALNITLVDPSHGRNELSAGSSSWGGGVLQDENGTYHLYYSRMMNGSTLSGWETESACWHGTSTSSPLGPFTDSDQLLQPFCHNAVPARAPPDPAHGDTGPTWLVYHIGCGAAGCGISFVTLMYSTAGPFGPWTPLGYSLLNGTGAAGSWDASISNIAPYIAANGSVLLAFRGKNSTKYERLGVASAPSWRGPYTRSASGPIFDAEGEDPWPWVDARGNVHMLFHSMRNAVGGHAFAREWTGPWTNAGTPPYTSNVTWVNGTVAALRRRERPQLVFDSATGAPAALFNGVVPGPDAVSDACFTMAAAINS